MAMPWCCTILQRGAPRRSCLFLQGSWQCVTCLCRPVSHVCFCWSAQVVQLDPSAAYSWSNVGLSLYHLGHISAAVDAFRSAVQLDESVGVAQLMLGSSLFELNRVDEVRCQVGS